MNLAKLFDMQRELGKVGLFAYKGPDRFNKLVLALLVELGECANEWRGFKFWSKDQEPRTKRRIPCDDCDGTGNLYWDSNYADTEKKYLECPTCKGFRKIYPNPLLEEYVDGLHFVLELGIELEYPELPFANFKPYSYTTPTIEEQFLAIYEDVTNFKNSVAYHSDDALMNFDELVSGYVGLGKMLGFTWEQIEQAYMEKNKVNHQRQSEGY